MRKIILVLLMLFIYSNINSQNLLDIKPTGYVTDIEGVFTLSQKSDLENLLKSYEDSTSIQIFLATSADFDFMYSTELGEKWKVGQADLNNGLLIVFSKSQRFCDMRTGYGLEPFLPDGWLKQMQIEVFPQYFKQELYYEGLKECIVRIQNKIGYDGYDFLIQQKELKTAQHKEAVSNFFGGLLKVILTLLLLFTIGYFIFIQYKKHQAYLALKLDILKDINRIDNLYSYFVGLNIKLPLDLELLYKSGVYKLKRKLVSAETKKHNDNIYNSLFKYKKMLNSLSEIINNIDSDYSYISNRCGILLPKKIQALYLSSKNDNIKNDLLKLTQIYNELVNFKSTIQSVNVLKLSVNSKKNIIEQKLKDTYVYCGESIKSDLNLILEKIEIPDEFTNENVNFLTTLEISINTKLSAIQSKVSNINEIIKAKDNAVAKIEQIRSGNSKYCENMNILQSVKIGNRLSSVNRINIDIPYIAKIFLNLEDCFVFLKVDNYTDAIKSYGKYQSELAVIMNAFNDASNLIIEYHKPLYVLI